MRLTTSERRSDPRRAIERPCKVRLLTSGKYVAGRTHDASSGGLLVTLDRRARLSPGDEIEVGVAWSSDAMLRADDMRRARIVRVLAEGEQSECAALSYLSPASAARAAA